MDLEANFPLVLLQTIFGSAHGIGYIVVYFMIPQVNQSLKIILKKFKKEGNNGQIFVGNNTSLDVSSDLIDNSWNRDSKNKLNSNNI